VPARPGGSADGGERGAEVVAGPGGEPAREPDDIGQLKQQVTHLAEENQQLRGSLAERDQDLAAARAASRELMARLNTRS
jgi:hypothetical protein